MPNLLLYVEARECLEQLSAEVAGPDASESHPLAYPEELFADRPTDSQAESAYETLLEKLFDGQRATRPEYAY